MRILHISDTHGLHRQLTDLPDADVLVHSGDVTRGGRMEEVTDFVEWLDTLPYSHKVFIAGNNDATLHRGTKIGLPAGCHLLRYSGVEICGLKFWGMPLDMTDVMHCLYDIRIGEMPSDTDVLITHEPPYCILDLAHGRHIGSMALYRGVDAIRPRLHLFGHAHGQNGTEEVGGVIFSNAALAGNRNALTGRPHVIDIV